MTKRYFTSSTFPTFSTARWSKSFLKSAQAGAAVLAAALVPLAAHAEGLYIGGNLGQGHWQDSVAGVQSGTTDLSGKIYGGYQVNPNFAVEAGGATLGESNESSGTIKGNVAFVDAVGTLPLAPQWSAIGRVGVLRGKVDTSNANDYGNGLKVGLGAQYEISKTTAVVGEWERYKLDVFGTHPDVDQFTVGVKAHF